MKGLSGPGKQPFGSGSSVQLIRASTAKSHQAIFTWHTNGRGQIELCCAGPSLRLDLGSPQAQVPLAGFPRGHLSFGSGVEAP